MLVKLGQIWSNLVKLGQPGHKLVLFGAGHYILIPNFCIFYFSLILFRKNILLLLLDPKHVIKLSGYNLKCYTSTRVSSFFLDILGALSFFVSLQGAQGPTPT